MASTHDAAKQHIIDTARVLFFQEGFKTISTDRMAKEAAISKTTLYKHFPNMAGILEAVLQEEVDAFDVGISLDINSQADFEQALISYGTNLLNYLNKPQMVQFAQLMFEEARLQPEVAKVFFDTAYQGTIQDLSQMMALGLKKGFLSSSLTPEELAEQLLGMWEGFRFIGAQLGLAKRPFDEPKKWALKCVKSLLSGQT